MQKIYTRLSIAVILLSILFSGIITCTLFPTNYLSGTLVKSEVDGKTAYIKLVVKGGTYTAAPIYYTTTVFSEGSASFSKSYVKVDEYTVWIFIDTNDNAAGDGTSLPDSGDYVIAEGRDIDMASDQTVNVDEGDWVVF